MLVTVLTVLSLCSALLTIRAASLKNLQRQVYLFKPLTIALLILIAVLVKHPVTPFYRYAILAGLLFSLAGDICLMWPRDKFLLGLVSFLVAHLCYIAAFASTGGSNLHLMSAAALMVHGVAMMRVLWPHLGKLRIPVVVYMLAILLMGVTALSRWLVTGAAGSELAAAGALLFVASDSFLAVDRFRGAFPGAQALVLGTYFAAQLLISLST